MAGLRFLERLRRIQHDPERHVTTSPDDVLQSVTSYVSKILNTRKGSTVLDEDFGIPDFTSAGLAFSQEDMPKVEREIADLIERCEPRLQHVEVHFTPDTATPLQMVFLLNAELRVAGYDVYPVHLVTRVDPLGKVTVS
ncbi:MAG: type VI secretion system baseplate subunit TssE [Desulfovibrionaceae bacterium]|nr:type VI secretion system baseplate subunit TssE [Desulfovibrionaceae bacterium]